MKSIITYIEEKLKLSVKTAKSENIITKIVKEFLDEFKEYIKFENEDYEWDENTLKLYLDEKYSSNVNNTKEDFKVHNDNFKKTLNDNFDVSGSLTVNNNDGLIYSYKYPFEGKNYVFYVTLVSSANPMRIELAYKKNGELFKKACDKMFELIDVNEL